MPLISLHRKQLFKVGIPLWVFINEQPIGIMRGKEVGIQIPNGEYDVSVRIVFQLYKWRFYIGGNKRVDVNNDDNVSLTITDKERWWNILFDIDLVLWLTRFFYTLPSPWDAVYEIVSNGFFVIWILRIWIIRKRYFILE